jgi:hypothetical protein
MKALIITHAQWDRILEEIKKRERPSTYLSREKMKQVLGFTKRNHEEWVKKEDAIEHDPDSDWLHSDLGGWYEGKTYQGTVHLDFYDEQKRTMFLLKYGNGQD